MADTLAFEDLEKVSDLIAQAIDEVGPDGEALFLSKLSLTLAYNIPQFSIIENAIQIARQTYTNQGDSIPRES